MFFYSQLPSSLPCYLSLYYPPPLTSDARGVTSVTISTIRNSCIVNNANIAVQNINTIPLDAINNWWGMPTGATHDNIPSGDAVGQKVLHAPHLPTMPFLCDLTSADWIPFSEQELQHAINSHIPHLGGIAFALIDFEWGRGAKFDIVTHPNYGNLHDVAYISIKPNPTGDLITIALDITTLPADENLQKIVTCELMPLFVNSLQQVQNRYVSPSQNIASMVVMDSDLMMRFTPPTEITPEPTPEFVLNYDASCLPNVTAVPTPTPSPTPLPNEDESGMLVNIPPLEGEFELLTTTPIESNLSTLSQPTIEILNENPCPDDAGWCDLLEQGDVFTYVNFNQLISINRVDDTIIEFKHILPAHISNPSIPSWGVVDAETHHYRLAFNCTANGYSNQLCYWDSSNNGYHHRFSSPGSGVISPDGQRIAQMIANTIWIWDLADNTYILQQNLRDENVNPLLPFGSVRWGDANTIYYSAFPFHVYSSNELEIWRYDFDTTSNTQIVEPDTTNYRVPMPLYFDARSNDLLYWMSGFVYSEYSLNYLGNWSYTSPDFTYYGVYWSPRPGENRAIRVKTNPENTNQYCIDTFQTASTPTNFNRIICRQMLFGFVDWATDVDLEATIQAPPTEECLAQTVGNATIRFSPEDFPEGQNQLNVIRILDLNSVVVSLRPSSGIQVKVLGRNTGFEIEEDWWWYVEISLDKLGLQKSVFDISSVGSNLREYEFEDGENSITGWMVASAIKKELEGCDIDNLEHVPIINYVTDEQIEIVSYNPIYDYPLDLPEPPWYTAGDWATLSIEEKFDTWRTEGAIYLWNESTISNRDYVCTNAPATRHNCTLLVYVVFHELFYRIYGPERPLMLSDILAITYELELATANITTEGANIAKQALGTYYFYQVGLNYCIRRPDTCNPITLEMPIEHFVYQYTYINNNGVEVISDGFLPPLNAWYHLGIRIADWYFGTPAVDLNLITQWQNIPTNLTYNRNLGGVRLQELLKLPDPFNNQRLVTMARLQLSDPRPRFSSTIGLNQQITWANFSYPGPLLGNEDTDFWKAVTADIPNEDINYPFKFCVLNQSYSIEDTGEIWRLDAFAIVTYNGDPGFGTTPPWADTNYSRSFGSYRRCVCSAERVSSGCP